MMYIHIKHDNCESFESDGLHNVPTGRNGKMRMSIGPYSRKAALAKAKHLQVEHRVLHKYRSRGVSCIIKVEKEPLEL